MEENSQDQILVESRVNRALESAVSHMLEGYQILDRDFRYLYVNPAAARHGKTTVEALLGRRMVDVYPGIECTELYARLRGAMFEGRVDFMTNSFTFPDGTLGDFELRIQPVPEGVVVFSIDVTEREKCNRRLRQAERLEAIVRITSGLAHDFNSMLIELLTGFDMLEAHACEPGRVKAEVDYLREETVRAARMLRQLLAFTRQKAGDPKCIDLHTIVDEMHPMLKALCGGEIAFSAELTPGLGAVVVDPGDVEQIILNLALNARDAMPQGGKLVIRTENVHLTEVDTHDHAALKPR